METVFTKDELKFLYMAVGAIRSDLVQLSNKQDEDTPTEVLYEWNNSINELTRLNQKLYLMMAEVPDESLQ